MISATLNIYAAKARGTTNFQTGIDLQIKDTGPTRQTWKGDYLYVILEKNIY